MKTSDKGRKFIESFEGLILQAYDDHNDRVVEPGQTPIGVLTIGYGHTDAAGPPKVYVGQKITQAEADKFLATDLSAVENEVNHLVKVTLNQNQFDALVSFQFNTGALSKSSVLTLLNSKDYATAADHLLLYNHAGGVVLTGLTRRRQAERTMFLAPSQPVRHVTTAVVTGAGAGAVVVANNPSHEGLIIAGIVVVLAIAVGLVIHFYNKGKTNVVSVPSVVDSQVHLV